MAAVVIGIILAIYLTVLKRNGWLGGSGQLYRCPNRECRKVFRKPVELKDLSETPACVYPACPHCGINLGTLFASGIEKKLSLKITAPVQHKVTEIKTVANVERRSLEAACPTENRGKELPRAVEIKTQIGTESCEKPGKTIVSAQPAQESREKSDTLLKPQQSHSQEKALGEEATSPNAESEFSDKSPKGCLHFFGYLRYLPKGSVAPDNCYSCPIMVDCYAIDRAAIDKSLRTLAHAITSEVYG